VQNSAYAVDKIFLSPNNNANEGCSARYIRQTWHMDFLLCWIYPPALGGKAVNDIIPLLTVFVWPA